MAALKKLPFLVLVLSIVVLIASTSLAVTTRDAELEQCRHRCRHQEGLLAECEERCAEEYYVRDRDKWDREKSPEEEEEQNPYVFRDEHFDTIIKTEEGRVHILKKFTEKSKLLKGIENYRIGFLEANPGAFVTPVHLDADGVIFVAKGKPTVTLLRKERRETFNLERGDTLYVPAGTPAYMVNRDEAEKVFMVKLIYPIFLPSQFETFSVAGDQYLDSFFKAFSWKVLEAAFKTNRDEIDKLIRQQKRGSITKASREQVEELSRHGGGGRRCPVWPFMRGKTEGPFNLFHKQPIQSNRYGRLFEANPEELKQLEQLDLVISFANITKGAMVAPYYNSKATKVSFVVDGEGWFEMACPHISSEHGGGSWRGRKSGQGFQRVSGRLRRGVVFVVPAGHPVTAIASENSNLQILCFEVNAKGNVRYPLAGRKNIVNNMENVAKELAFGVPAREVERIFRSQNEEFFFPGPTQQEEGGHHHVFSII